MRLKKKKILLALCILCLLAAGWFGYIAGYYHSDVTIEEYQNKDGSVSVTLQEGNIMLDGPGTENALIFYPGAKVEYTAYLPLCYRLAERGIDVFLVKMPCNLAIFGRNSANAILAAYDYENWYLSGHSLGGAMAASYAAEHPNTLKGLILLAAYPTKSLQDDDFSVLSVYGSEDGILNRAKVAAGRAIMPADYTEFVIDGGNHAGFGNYGAQKGDGAASIDRDAQQEQSVDAVINMIAVSH